MDAEFREQRKKTFTALKTYHHDRTSANHRENWQLQRNNLKKLREEKITTFFANRWVKVEASKNMQEFWGALNLFRPRECEPKGDSREDEWIRHFNGLLNSPEHETIQQPMPPNEDAREATRDRSATNLQHPQFGPDSQDTPQWWNADISRKEVSKALAEAKNNKAPGADGISVKFLKGLPAEGKAELHWTINAVWKATAPTRGLGNRPHLPHLQGGGGGQSSKLPRHLSPGRRIQATHKNNGQEISKVGRTTG